MTTNNSVNVTLSGQSGTGNFAGTTSPTFVTPTIGAATGTSLRLSNTGVLDNNGNSIIALTATASSVNHVTINNGSTGNAPVIQAVGSDTNINLLLTGQGTGGVALLGTGTNDNAGLGYVGEYQSSNIASGSAISLSNNTSTNLTSISLTAGDWNVWGSLYIVPTGNWTIMEGGINTSSATLPDSSIKTFIQQVSAVTGAQAFSVPMQRVSISVTTTVYIIGFCTFSNGTCTFAGNLAARRVR